MLTNGWVRLDKKITDWEWYDDPNTFRLFIHLLLTCNYEKKKWRGMIIEPGQRVITFRKLAKEMKLSVKQIRTCIARLKSTHNVAQQSTHQYTLVTICNYSDYQLCEDIQGHSERHTKGHTKGTYITSKQINNNIIKKHNIIVNGKPLTYYFEKIPLIFNSSVEPYPHIPQIIKLTNTRKQVIKARLSDELSTLPSWRFYFDWAMQSKFLREDCTATSFDWLLKPSNIINIREGKYHDGKQQPKEEYK